MTNEAIKFQSIKRKENNLAGELGSWLGESVIDFEKKDLNPALWDGKKIRREVVDQIWDAIDPIIKEAEVKRNRLTAVLLEGSNLTYYYNKYTDIDIHMFIRDVTEEEEAIINEAIKEFNKEARPLEGTENRLELYLMGEEQYERKSGARYDLIEEQWLADPKKIDVPAETYQAAVEISLTFARDLDLAIGELKRDIIEYVALDAEIEDMLNVDIEQFRHTKKMKVSEIKADMEALAMKEQMLKDMRRAAYSEEYIPEEETLYYLEDGEYDRSYTLYNMVFKILQRFGYIDPLKMIKYDIYKKALENKDFDEKAEYYLRQIIKVLGLFNKIDLRDEDLNV